MGYCREMTTTRPAIAFIYARISEDREGRELGVGRQDEDCTALAARLGRTVAGVFIDNDTGASTRSRKPRPEYRKVLQAAQDAAALFDVAIIAATSGRLTRRPRENEDLIDLAMEHGVRYEYVKSPSFDLNTAAGRRIARTLAAQDAGEAEDISERVTRAAEQRARDGLNHGGRRAYGYTPNGLVRIAAEAHEVKRMFKQLLAGVPLGAIVRELDEREVPTYSGKPWSASTVRGMLLRPRYAGLREYQGEVIGPATWPAIVSEDIWRAAVALLENPARRTTTGNKASYLLSGLAFCGPCGGKITSAGVKRVSKDGEWVVRHYRCRARGCSKVNRRLDWVEDYVSAVVVARLSEPDAAALLVDDDRPDAGSLRTEAQALRLGLDGLATALAEGLLDLVGVRRESERLRAKLAEVEAQMAHSARAPVLADLVGAEDVQAAWDGLTLDRKRAVVSVLLTVTLHPVGGGWRTFDPSKVDIQWRTE